MDVPVHGRDGRRPFAPHHHPFGLVCRVSHRTYSSRGDGSDDTSLGVAWPNWACLARVGRQMDDLQGHRHARLKHRSPMLSKPLHVNTSDGHCLLRTLTQLTVELASAPGLHAHPLPCGELRVGLVKRCERGGSQSAGEREKARGHHVTAIWARAPTRRALSYCKLSIARRP
jgi:hypothetical protein